MNQSIEDDEGIISAQEDEDEKKDDREEKEEKRSWLWHLLDKLEDLEIRMIYGIFSFIFVRVPCFITDILIEWFPTFLKLLKVAVLFAAWCLIVIGPIVFLTYNSYKNEHYPGTDSFQDLLYYIIKLQFLEAPLQFSESYIIWIWSFLGIIGSVWGILYIRRKKRSLLTRMKRFFRRHA